jgi:hypothetical protein
VRLFVLLVWLLSVAESEIFRSLGNFKISYDVKNNTYTIKYLKNCLHVYNVLVSYNTR